jgi:hypothetical protein
MMEFFDSYFDNKWRGDDPSALTTFGFIPACSNNCINSRSLLLTSIGWKCSQTCKRRFNFEIFHTLETIKLAWRESCSSNFCCSVFGHNINSFRICSLIALKPIMTFMGASSATRQNTIITNSLNPWAGKTPLQWVSSLIVSPFQNVSFLQDVLINV